MIYKNFIVHVIIRILFIAVAMTVSVYYFLTGNYIRASFAGVLVIGLLIELVRFINKTNKTFETFITSVRNNDFSQLNTLTHKGRSFDRLSDAYHELVSHMQNLSTEREMKQLFLEHLIEQMDIGVLTYDENEKIVHVNKAFRKLLNAPSLRPHDSLSLIKTPVIESLRAIKPEDNQLLKLTINNKIMQLAIQASEFKLQGNYFKLITMKNIHEELEDTELESYKKLIRVLTHEIMNSVAPITSLTGTLNEMMKDKNASHDGLDKQSAAYIKNGIEAILSRGEGLLSFTEAYQNLTRIPSPEFKTVDVKSFLERISLLHEKDMQHCGINFQLRINKDVRHVIADPSLLEQVLINLIKNARESVEGIKDPSITIFAGTTIEGQTMIDIMDNGIGIPDDLLDRIFVPFFTTKEHGFGIGLNLSQQILQMHKGSLSVSSKPGEGSIFRIIL
jgi:nitrogen fixation/metabolism regulation signal transduction histidine kinase